MEGKATREALGDELLKLADERENIFVIDCDVAKSCKTLAIGEELPGRHINVGISEQNAVGVAAGLATCGATPFVVTYAVFGSMRAVEQIRQSVCYPKLNVKILCSHGGLTPANDGATHQCIEDMGILRTIPGMTIVMPADYCSARKLIRAAADAQGPVYLRFTRDAVSQLYDENEEFVIGKAKHLRRGKDISIIANGDCVSIAGKAADLLEEEGISVDVYDMHTIKPLDGKAVRRALADTGKIITVEDHNVINGLGSAVAEVIAEEGRGILKRIGVQDHFGESAPYEKLLEMNGISAQNIAACAKKMLRR